LQKGGEVSGRGKVWGTTISTGAKEEYNAHGRPIARGMFAEVLRGSVQGMTTVQLELCQKEEETRGKRRMSGRVTHEKIETGRSARRGTGPPRRKNVTVRPKVRPRIAEKILGKRKKKR